jgi:hypothetical protein
MISSKPKFDRGVLCLVFIFETLLFWTVYNREVAWYPPANFDQASYLISTYRLQEDILTHGVGKFWKEFWSPGHAQGVALPMEGALSGLIIGGARFPQLCVNWIFFLILQAVVFYAARDRWGSRFYGYIALGLVLCEATAWSGAGGVFDFRIDLAAYCLYGIWVCSVLRSKVFLDRQWAFLSGLIGAFLVLHRFLTAVYLLGVTVGLAVVCVIIGVVVHAPALKHIISARLKNLGISCGLLIAVAGPLLLLNSTTIWNYYVGGHLVSTEKYIRASQVGVHDLAGHLLFYPTSIIKDHLGSMFFWALAIAIIGAAAANLLNESKRIRAVFWNETFLSQFIFLLGAIAGPILVLTADPSKSSIVGGIVGVPIALLVVLLLNAIWPKNEELHFRLNTRLLAASAFSIFGLGVFNQLSRAGRHWPEFADGIYLNEMTELNQWLANYARDYRWRNPAISFDIISSFLNCGTVTATGFEKTGRFVEFHTLLGSAILGQSQEEALKLLEQSDFVVLTSPHEIGDFPFTQAIAAYWPELKGWADKHLVMIKTQQADAVFPHNVMVYARPSAQLRGVSGDWIISAGVVIEAKRDDLQRFPLVRLQGRADFSALPKIPVVTAGFEPSSGPVSIPAGFRRIGDRYEIDVNTSSIQLPRDQTVRIRVKFDTFFIRKDAKLHNDFRELVVRSPEVSLLPVEPEERK